MEKNIKEFARSLGAAACGICRADENTDSLVVCLFPYFHASSGNLSLHAMGRDYHKVVGEKLALLKEYLLSLFPTATVTCQVDIGEYVDKHYAQRSGLGFFGKNNLIISEACGSFSFIGFCRIDRALAPDAPNEGSCLGCNACVVACPGGAIGSDGSFSEARCASYISQKRGALSEEEISILEKSGLAWGCDRCQAVCPHNNGLSEGLSDFRVLHKGTLSAEELAALTNREFQEKFSEFSFAYRGKGVLLRNCRILENKKDE